jgi:hypothetical protein
MGLATAGKQARNRDASRQVTPGLSSDLSVAKSAKD